MNFPIENEAEHISQHTLVLSVSKQLMGWLLQVRQVLFNLTELSPEGSTTKQSLLIE